jgi:uncharacterized membrane protein YkoI
MNRKFVSWILLLSIVLGVLLTSCSKVGENAAPIAGESVISAETAKAYALADAGVSSADAVFVQVEKDWEGALPLYEVKFYEGNTEYDYEISATDGRVISKDTDIDNYQIPAPSSETAPPSEESPTDAPTPSESAPVVSVPSPSGITAEEAKQIALRDAALSEADVRFYRVDKSWDDGRMEYEVEFYSGNTEYDYDIDATTGAILSKDTDVEGFSIPSAPQNSESAELISEERAVEIALSKAGLTADGVRFVRAEIGYENGRKVWEIEFSTASHEYEYEIDAVTGAVLHWESESVFD